MIFLAVLFAAVSGFLWPSDHRSAVRRYTALVPNHAHRTPTATHGSMGTAPLRSRPPPPVKQPQETPGPVPHRGRREVLTRHGAVLLSGTMCAVLLGGPFGVLAGIAAAVAVARVLGRLESTDQRRRKARLVADLPVAIDLLAACLQGGTPWSDAVEAVARAIGGPLGAELERVAVQIRLGVDPSTAWLGLADEPTLAPLARTAVRAVNSGAAIAPTLTRLARDQRRAARAEAMARARTAGIRVLAPLGLCFLPAFVLLGIVPTIAGIASTLLLPW
ncbi:type II secretion system F family protein [Actinomadura keratinilytica]|uniref:Type II secretion system F family protein n=1 Tax=Actinomadura keratinilytica TaxID=547461 RepID=A0ABP7YE81_9ACTN